jgi:hypothetical protein
MPYIIKKFNNGYKLCKKDDKNKCFSNEPITKNKAEKQLKAILINENKEGGNNPVDKELYEKIKKEIYEKNKKHSLFRSASIVKEYKRQGGKFENEGKEENKMNIPKWFKQSWVSVNDYYHDKNFIPCGSSNTQKKFNEYPLCRPKKLLLKLSDEQIKKLIEEKNKIKNKPLITKNILNTDKFNIKNTLTGTAKDKFIKQLEEINYSPDLYLKNAKEVAKKEGYEPNNLFFANNNDNKLLYKSPEGDKYFGKAGYGDFLIWTFKENKGEVKKGFSNKKRNVFRKSHGKITKIYNLGKYSPNELAINILW